MNITPKELSLRLAGEVERVCRDLLPAGRRVGNEWEAGGTDGGTGKSLKVHLAGEKAGVWSDFATDESGDLLDLWGAVRGLDLGKVIQEVKAYLGVREPEWSGYKPKAYDRPQRPAQAKKIKAESAVMEYLHGRGVTDETLKAFRIAEEPGDIHFRRLEDNPGTIVFPYLREDELIAVKYLALDRPNGKKQIMAEKNCEPCLFGWQALNPVSRSVIICEGEIDAMILHQIGAQALSVPAGASNHDWVIGEYQSLERFDEIFLCFDSDEAGKKGLAKLIDRLGRHRCRVIDLPHNDPAECWAQGWREKEFAGAIMSAKYLSPDGLRNASEFVDEVIAEFYPGPDAVLGAQTPWEKIGKKLLFRPAEVSMWTGFNGHGKTQILSYIAAAAMANGERFCVASMEMPARRQLYRAVKQLSGVTEPSIPYIRAIHSWLEDRLWLFSEIGSVKIESILEVFRYARRRFQCTHFVVDSLAKCGLAEDDYNAQKAVIDKLCAFSHEFDVHVYVVAHARKGSDENSRPGKMDVKGTGSLTDLVDTVISVWRNKPKEAKISSILMDGEEPGDDLRGKPDAVIEVCKQRNGEWEGTIPLWFDHGTLQYLSNKGESSHSFVPFTHTSNGGSYGYQGN